MGSFVTSPGGSGASLASTQEFTGVNTFSNAAGIKIGKANVDSGVVEMFDEGSAFNASITPVGLTGNRTLFVPDHDGTAATLAGTETLTNKRVKPRITSVVSSATPAINTDACDVVTITALATAITSLTTNLTGTPADGELLMIRFKDDGTARAITHGASFVAEGAALLTTTTVGKVSHELFIWDAVKSKWGCISASTES